MRNITWKIGVKANETRLVGSEALGLAGVNGCCGVPDGPDAPGEPPDPGAHAATTSIRTMRPRGTIQRRARSAVMPAEAYPPPRQPAGVIAARIPGMAPGDAPGAHPAALEQPVALDGL